MCSRCTKSSNPNRPTMMDGSDASVSVAVRMTSVRRFAGRELGHIDARADSEGNADQHRQEEEVDRIEQRRPHAPTGDNCRRGGNEVQREIAPAFDDEIEQERGEQADDPRRERPDDRRRDPVGDARAHQYHPPRADDANRQDQCQRDQQQQHRHRPERIVPRRPADGIAHVERDDARQRDRTIRQMLRDDFACCRSPSAPPAPPRLRGPGRG